MELTGKILRVLDIKQGVGKTSGKEWKKREILVQTFGQYPQQVAISLWGEKAELDFVKEGATITCKVELASREYNDNFYTEVRAWQIFLVVEQSSISSREEIPTNNDVEDLPF